MSNHENNPFVGFEVFQKQYVSKQEIPTDLIGALSALAGGGLGALAATYGRNVATAVQESIEKIKSGQIPDKEDIRRITHANPLRGKEGRVSLDEVRALETSRNQLSDSVRQLEGQASLERESPEEMFERRKEERRLGDAGVWRGPVGSPEWEEDDVRHQEGVSERAASNVGWREEARQKTHEARQKDYSDWEAQRGAESELPSEVNQTSSYENAAATNIKIPKANSATRQRVEEAGLEYSPKSAENTFAKALGSFISSYEAKNNG